MLKNVFKCTALQQMIVGAIALFPRTIVKGIPSPIPLFYKMTMVAIDRFSETIVFCVRLENMLLNR